MVQRCLLLIVLILLGVFNGPVVVADTHEVLDTAKYQYRIVGANDVVNGQAIESLCMVFYFAMDAVTQADRLAIEATRNARSVNASVSVVRKRAEDAHNVYNRVRSNGTVAISEAVARVDRILQSCEEEAQAAERKSEEVGKVSVTLRENVKKVMGVYDEHSRDGSSGLDGVFGWHCVNDDVEPNGNCQLEGLMLEYIECQDVHVPSIPLNTQALKMAISAWEHTKPRPSSTAGIPLEKCGAVGRTDLSKCTVLEDWVAPYNRSVVLFERIEGALDELRSIVRRVQSHMNLSLNLLAAVDMEVGSAGASGQGISAESVTGSSGVDATTAIRGHKFKEIVNDVVGNQNGPVLGEKASGGHGTVIHHSDNAAGTGISTGADVVRGGAEGANDNLTTLHDAPNHVRELKNSKRVVMWFLVGVPVFLVLLLGVFAILLNRRGSTQKEPIG